MNKYRELLITVVLFCFIVPGKAQLINDTTLIKTLPKIAGWHDNDHYIYREWNEETKSYVNLKANIANEKIESSVATPNSSQKVKEENGNIYFLSGKNKRQLTNSQETDKLPLLSPDKKTVAFLRNNDLYTVNVESGVETRYTQDGSDVVMNGYASWVYYEEILKRPSEYRAFWWSPDSKRIVFYRFDDSEVPVFPLHNSEGQHGDLELTRYPKPGDPNPKVKIGIVTREESEITWADFNVDEDQYFGTPFWTPNGESVLVQWMPRRQNELILYQLDVNGGTKSVLYRENQETWIDWIPQISWVDNGFLFIRDFEGWEHIYHQTLDGKEPKRLTQGNHWNTKIVFVKEGTDFILFTSQGEQSTRQDIYRVNFEGHQNKVSQGPYTNKMIYVAPDGQHLITHYSNTSTPTVQALINTKNGEYRILADSKGVNFENANFKKREIIWMETSDGLRLPATITYPKDMQEGETYPVYIFVYGGPKYQSVNDGWVNPSVNMGEKPFIRVNMDHRGAGHQGKEGLNYLYGNLGKWEMADYIEWVKTLKNLPQVDSTQILITGGSYGGYLTALALTYGSDHFSLGMADYPVTDWMLYDSHYTERYMGLPKDNPEGYQFGSVLTHIDEYRKNGKGMLYIQHGTMDDNVHIQNTYQLVDKLQRKNKDFEMMVYPGERHSWVGKKTNFVGKQRKRFLDRYFFKK